MALTGVRARAAAARAAASAALAARRAEAQAVAARAHGDGFARGDGLVGPSPAVEVHVEQVSQVPPAYRVVSEYAWRFLVMVGAIAVVGWAATKVSLVVIAALVGVLVTALLSPANVAFRRGGMSRAAAAATAFFGGIAVLVALIWFITVQLMSGFGDLQSAVTDAVDDLAAWLRSGPLQLGVDFTRLQEQALSLAESNRQKLTSQALTIVSALGHFFAGLALVLFTTFFLLYDGRRVWLWVLRLLPRGFREDADDAALHGWATLVGYVRGTCAVAAVDAFCIGIGLLVLGVPLAVPLAILIFLGAFVPLVGATVTGILAVLVALATKGVVSALITIGIILAVQQLEGHILQPLLLGRLVNVHPLGVVLAVAAGSLVAGIAGAVFAVPLVAVVNSVGSTLAARARARAAPYAAMPAKPSPEEAAAGEESAAAPPITLPDTDAARYGASETSSADGSSSGTVPPLRQ